MRPHFVAIVLLAAASLPARTPLAQSALGQQPATGTLQQPTRPTAPAAPQVTPATNPPAPAPRTPVQQAAPSARPTPVVQPPANAHAQKPPPAPAKPTAAPPPTAPPPVPAPPPAAVAKPPEAPAKPAEPSVGSVTKQPLPRWASLRSDEVNLRTGPGTRYPVEWVYKRRDLPVEIEREYEAWRLIADQDGVKGWVHSATLVGRRAFAVRGREQTLRKSAADDAAAVAVLKPGVVGRLRACEAAKAWCEVQVGEHRGFIKRDAIWGVYPGEAVN